MKLLLGTSNPHKVKEILRITGWDPLLVVTPKSLGVTEQPVENGKDFLENALIKASFYYEHGQGLPCLAEDTGLEVRALDGQPGLMSARFAGPGHDDRANRRKLLESLKGVDDRSARFVCHAVLVLPDLAVPGLPEGVSEIRPLIAGTRAFHCEGRVNGVIIDMERGHGGFGYDPVFLYPELGLTFAELSEAQKNGISHRANALKRFLPFLNAILGL